MPLDIVSTALFVAQLGHAADRALGLEISSPSAAIQPWSGDAATCGPGALVTCARYRPDAIRQKPLSPGLSDWGTADNFYQQTKRIAPRSS